VNLASGARGGVSALVAMALALAAVVTSSWGVAPVVAATPVTWSSVTAPAGTTNLSFSGVACSAATCVATGYPCGVAGCVGFNAGLILYSGDHAATWSVAAVPSNVGNLSHVTCANSADCMAIGATGPPGPSSSATVLTTMSYGAKWIATTAPSASLSGVACVAYSRCYVDGATRAGVPVMFRSNNFGATWSRLRVPAGVASVGSIDCSTMTNCLGVGVAKVGANPLSLMTVNAGRSWRVGHLPKSMGTVGSASCLSATRCVVVGDLVTGHRGVVTSTSNGGLTWKALARLAGTRSMSGVSCYTPTSCVAVGTAGSATLAPLILATSSRGAGWQSQPAPVGTSNLNGGVACEPSGVCVAVGQWFTFSGVGATDDGPYILVN
jgi:hypothetical protein